MSDKHKLLVGRSKGTGEENEEEKKKVNVIIHESRAGSMGNSVASQSLSDDGPDREVIEKKVRTEKVKNKNELAARKGRNADEVTNGKKRVQSTGDVGIILGDKEKKRRKKTECISKAEKQEHKEKVLTKVISVIYSSRLYSAMYMRWLTNARIVAFRNLCRNQRGWLI